MPYWNRRRKIIFIILFVCMCLTFKALSEWNLLNYSLSSYQKSGSDKKYWLKFNHRDIYALMQGSIDLTLQIHINKMDLHTRKKPCRSEHEVMLNTASNRCISFSELERKHEADFKRPDIYQLYPQDVPMPLIVERVQAGLPVAQEPIFNHPLQAIRVSKRVCSFKPTGEPRKKYDVVIIVKSALLHFDKRDEFRKQIHSQTPRRSFSWDFVFSLGLPRRFGANEYVREGIPYHLPGPLGELFLKYDGRYDEVIQRVNKEIDEHDDIILGDFEDTYFNLTLKASFNLRWAAAFCANSATTILIHDDDNLPKLSKLDMFLHNIPLKEKQSLLIGDWRYYDRSNSDPTEKQFLSIREMPWNIQAPYPVGRAMFIGSNLLRKLAIAGAFTKELRLDDVWIGLLCAKLNIVPSQKPMLNLKHWMSKLFFYDEIEP